MEKPFNPKCNQSTGTAAFSKGPPSCAEAAAEAMRKHAAYRAEEAALERVREMETQKGAVKADRWVTPESIRK